MRAITCLFIALSISLVLKAQEITDNGYKFLVGEISTTDLSKKPYGDWYLTNYDDYTVKQHLVEKFKIDLEGHQVLIFLGTWCGDSKREVPRFMKIMDDANFPSENLKTVALDRRKEHYKKSPNGEEWGLNIKRVPTFIFYKNGREVNRVIETPNKSLEEDILAILTTNTYIANKAKSLHFD